MKYIKGEGIQEGRVEIIQGWFEETLNNKTIGKYNLNHAAIVHIDSDLYESAKTVLDFIGPLLVDGSIIIFDNWFTYNGNPNFGEQKAFREWSDFQTDWNISEYQKEGPWRNSFILNKL